MTDAEVMVALRSDTPLNRARKELSAAIGRAEQEAMQRRSPGPIEMRRAEFEAVERILATFECALRAENERLREALTEMLRLADMSFEESLREPEENGNYATYNRARAALAHPANKEGAE